MFGYDFIEMLSICVNKNTQIELRIRTTTTSIKATLRTPEGIVRNSDSYLILRDCTNREIVIPATSVVYMTVDELAYLSDKPRKNYIQW